MFDDDALEDLETFEGVLTAQRGFESLVNLTLPTSLVIIEDNDRGNNYPLYILQR